MMLRDIFIDLNTVQQRARAKPLRWRGREEKNSQSQRKEAQKLRVEKLAEISRKAFKTTDGGLERWLPG